MTHRCKNEKRRSKRDDRNFLGFFFHVSIGKSVALDATKSENPREFKRCVNRAIPKAVSIDPPLCLFVVDSRFSFYDSRPVVPILTRRTTGNAIVVSDFRPPFFLPLTEIS